MFTDELQYVRNVITFTWVMGFGSLAVGFLVTANPWFLMLFAMPLMLAVVLTFLYFQITE